MQQNFLIKIPSLLMIKKKISTQIRKREGTCLILQRDIYKTTNGTLHCRELDALCLLSGRSHLLSHLYILIFTLSTQVPLNIIEQDQKIKEYFKWNIRTLQCKMQSTHFSRWTQSFCMWAGMVWVMVRTHRIESTMKAYRKTDKRYLTDGQKQLSEEIEAFTQML